MSKSLNNIPTRFYGSERVYHVFGVQDQVVYGVNIHPKIVDKQGTFVLEMVFACLGQPPESTPFHIRAPGHFPYFMTEDPQEQPERAKGFRLDKTVIKLGEGMGQFTAVSHLHTQMPALKKWLDDTCETAGIMQVFDTPDEIFEKFFGAESNPNYKAIEFDLPPIGALKAGETPPPKVDFSKYGISESSSEHGDSQDGTPADKFGHFTGENDLGDEDGEDNDD